MSSKPQYTKKEAKARVEYLTKCINYEMETRFIERSPEQHQRLANYRTHRYYLRKAYGVK